MRGTRLLVALVTGAMTLTIVSSLARAAVATGAPSAQGRWSASMPTASGTANTAVVALFLALAAAAVGGAALAITAGIRRRRRPTKE